jgi:hypothetical protein
MPKYGQTKIGSETQGFVIVLLPIFETYLKNSYNHQFSTQFYIKFKGKQPNYLEMLQ